MEQYELKEMLTHVADGSVSVEEAVRRLKRAPFEEIGIASLDAHRGIRQGASEIIYGAGKTAAQIVKIAETLWNGGQQTILITRVDAEKAEAVREAAGGRRTVHLFCGRTHRSSRQESRAAA